MVRIMYMYTFSLMLSVARIAIIECISSSVVDTLTCLSTSEVVRLLRERAED